MMCILTEGGTNSPKLKCNIIAEAKIYRGQCNKFEFYITEKLNIKQTMDNILYFRDEISPCIPEAIFPT